jgi:hypothetical protein
LHIRGVFGLGGNGDWEDGINMATDEEIMTKHGFKKEDKTIRLILNETRQDEREKIFREFSKDKVFVAIKIQMEAEKKAQFEKGKQAGAYCQLCKKSRTDVGLCCVECFQQANKDSTQAGRDEVIKEWRESHGFSNRQIIIPLEKRIAELEAEKGVK